ncbi:hypothetical protein E4T43_08484 [Aureobasidium subglaciale]|nr:hypothetical protein E4T43_08484 [Aureobasidium subglaciale]
MFTLRQSLGALAAIAAAPLAYAVPITTFSRIGKSSNGMDILKLQVHAAMSPGHLTTNTTMSFVVDTHDMKTTCFGEWAPEGPFPEGEYWPCANSSVGWNFKEDTYKGMNEFTLQLEYSYEDDSVGEYPYNRVTEFSHADITTANIDCSAKTESCQQCTNSTITAIVYASIA